MFCKISVQNAFIKELYFAIVTFLVFAFSGCSRAYTAFLFLQLDEEDSDLKITDEQLSWIASLQYLVNPVGCLGSGIVMDMIGRKQSIEAIFVAYVISFVIFGLAKSVFLLYIGMIISGISSGMSFCVGTYVSEITRAKYRAGISGFTVILYAIGIFFCNMLMYLLPWYKVSFVFAVLSFLSIILSFNLPESPIWLLIMSRRQRSIETLCSLRCKQQVELQSEIAEMERMCELLRSRTLKNILKTIRDCWKFFLILTFLFILCVSTGYMLFISYTLMIIEKLDIPYDASKVAIVYSLVSCASTLLCPFVNYKLKRKILLTISAGGMAVSLLIIVLYKQFFSNSYKMYAWIVPLSLYTYVFSCMFGVFIITFLVGGELFPREVAGIMNGLYGSIGYIAAGFYSKIFPWFLVRFGINSCLWILCAVCFITCLYGIIFLPETKGKTLSEIREKYFCKNTPLSTK